MSDACTAAFLRLEAMVRRAEEPPRGRTIEDEDRIALEDMILELEGPDALARYQHKWAVWGLSL